MIAGKIDGIDRDIALIFEEEMFPKARSATLVAYAREVRNEALAINTAALGIAPNYATFVDGTPSDDLPRVHPNGVIVFEFELFAAMFGWIDLQLITHSPVGKAPRDRHPGLYRRSHKLVADGIEVEPDGSKPLPDAREFVYLNTVPYARLIESGHSRQAPDGVYQVIATLAARRFGNLAKVSFQYRRLEGASTGGRDDRQPAIVITV